MNYNFLFIMLALLPLSVSAQTRTTTRRPTTAATSANANRSQASRATSAPVKRTAQTTRFTTPQPAQSTQQPVAQAQPAVSEPVSAPVAQAPVNQASQSVYTQAQKPTKQRPESRFRFGVRLGANSSSIGGADVASVGDGVQLERVTGFHGGVVFNIGGPVFSVQPEILFSQYGTRLAIGSDYLQVKYNLVEVPILLKVAFGQPNVRFFVNAGPVGTFAANGTVSVRESGQTDSQSIDLSQEGRFNYGVSGGAGVSIKAGPGSVLLEGRYSYLVGSDDKSTPQNAMISVGYLFPLGGR
ncbi:hypothetical protein GCM10028807_43280 [Spirosoma daeguense]